MGTGTSWLEGILREILREPYEHEPGEPRNSSELLFGTVPRGSPLYARHNGAKKRAAKAWGRCKVIRGKLSR